MSLPISTAAPCAAPDFRRDEPSLPDLVAELDWLSQVEAWLKRAKLLGRRGHAGHPLTEWHALLAQREDPEDFLRQAALGYALDCPTPPDLLPLQAWMVERLDYCDELVRSVLAHLLVDRSLADFEFEDFADWERRELMTMVPAEWNWDHPAWNDWFVSEVDGAIEAELAGQ